MRVLEKQKLIYEKYGPIEVRLDIATYPNGRVGLQLESKCDDIPGMEWEPWATASVNLPDCPCPENEVWIKDYSENEGMAEWLIKIGVLEKKPTAHTISGYVSISRYRFTAPFMVEMGNALARSKKRSKQRGEASVELLAGIAAVIMITVMAGFVADTLIKVRRLADDVHQIRMHMNLATCTTDMECVRACQELGGGKECEDVMGAKK